MQIMNSIKTTRQIESCIAHLVRSGAMLMGLLFAFVAGVRAEDNTDDTENSNTVSQIIRDTGIDKDNGVVYLNDLEDHTWTYYSGINPEVDPSKDPSDMNSGYNNKYSRTLYDPNPRNVKITYNGGGIQNAGTGNANAAVGIDESETLFVYYKTLESKKEGNSCVYPYTTIANPFSKRPSRVTTNNAGGSSKQFYGFAGWKVVKIAGCTLRGSGSTTYSTAEGNNIIPAETELVISLTEGRESAYTTALTNDATAKTFISAELILEAVWEEAKVIYLTDETGDYTFPTNQGGTYETNFLVLKCNPTKITLNSPCTIMMVEPDGSAKNEGITFTGPITPMPGSNGRTKIEYTHWEPASPIDEEGSNKGSIYIDVKGRNFNIGRGMTMSATKKPVLYGNYTNSSTVDQILKVESGIFKGFSHYENKKPTSIVKQWITLGCDYDRAGADNDKLDIQGEMLVGRNVTLPTNSTQEICRVYSLSGKFMSTRAVSGGSTNDSYYLRVRSNANKGHVFMEILGGNWKGIAGGWGDTHTPSEPAFTFRMRGGLLEGALYGAAEYYNAAGTRTFVITGGTIKGWVAGGANGTKYTKGMMDGVSYVYVGGNAQINSGDTFLRINRAIGGNVFGAGCGYCDVSNSGQVTLGTNVVIADKAYVQRGVYGGGSFGYTEASSNIYITGGTVGGMAGGVTASYSHYDTKEKMDIYTAIQTENIPGGVYGGACQNKAGNVNIYMTGGTVNGGLYGGSNASGTLSGNVNMTIAGGNVGSQEKATSVYGGGYGNSTTVNGNTNITMTGGTINGNVFGGGNKGAVAKKTDNTGGNTTVTITGGTVTGNVYGGGNEAEVEGQTKVVVGSSGQ